MIATQKKLLWAKMTSTKIQAQNSNIAKRMGKIEKLEKGMALLNAMRHIIGETEYGKRVQHVLAAFPSFDTYDATVNASIVIDLVDDEEEVGVLDDDDCRIVVVPALNKNCTAKASTSAADPLSYATFERPKRRNDNNDADYDDISEDDDPTDLRHIVVCQGNPLNKMVLPDDSDNDEHDDNTPGPVVFNSA